MIVLVRCKDGSCSVALESCLDGLINSGIITAYLDRGKWVAAVPREMTAKMGLVQRRISPDRVVAAVA